jgi:hypothetical protein
LHVACCTLLFVACCFVACRLLHVPCFCLLPVAFCSFLLLLVWRFHACGVLRCCWCILLVVARRMLPFVVAWCIQPPVACPRLTLCRLLDLALCARSKHHVHVMCRRLQLSAARSLPITRQPSRSARPDACMLQRVHDSRHAVACLSLRLVACCCLLHVAGYLLCCMLPAKAHAPLLGGDAAATMSPGLFFFVAWWLSLQPLCARPFACSLSAFPSVFLCVLQLFLTWPCVLFLLFASAFAVIVVAVVAACCCRCCCRSCGRTAGVLFLCACVHVHPYLLRAPYHVPCALSCCLLHVTCALCMRRLLVACAPCMLLSPFACGVLTASVACTRYALHAPLLCASSVRLYQRLVPLLGACPLCLFSAKLCVLLLVSLLLLCSCLLLLVLLLPPRHTVAILCLAPCAPCGNSPILWGWCCMLQVACAPVHVAYAPRTLHAPYMLCCCCSCCCCYSCCCCCFCCCCDCCLQNRHSLEQPGPEQGPLQWACIRPL